MTLRTSSPPLAPPSTRRLEHRLLLGMSIACGLATLLVLTPFLPWFVLSLWTASLMQPWVERLTVATGGRKGAAGLAVVVLLVLFIVPIVIFGFAVAADAYHLARNILTSSSGRSALTQLVSADSTSKPIAGSLLDVKTLMGILREHGAQAFGAATFFLGAIGSAVLGIFVYFLATYAALVHGREAYNWALSQLPVASERTDRLSAAFQETGRGLLFSVVMTGAVQALIATISYAALGVPRAAALGFATFIASLLPVVGSALVWGPVVLGLFLVGHTTKALILLAIAAGGVSTVDNVLRPLFARWGSLKLDTILLLFAMLGGVLTIGGWGLILGPLALRLTLELVALARETQHSERPPVRTPRV